MRSLRPVRKCTNSGGIQLRQHRVGVFDVTVCNGNHNCLNRSKPNGECPAVVLDEDADEALERTKEGTVDHVWLVLLTVLADVCQSEALRQVEVELHGRTLPEAAYGVTDVHVNLGPVERATALVNLERHAALF